MKVKRSFIYITVGAILVVAGFTLAYETLLHRTTPIPDYIQRAAKFTLYYPKSASVDQRSMSLTDSNSLLSYVADYQGSQIYITIQAKPSSTVNIEGIEKQFTDSTEFLTDIGAAAVGDFSGRRVGSLVTSNSWIFISAQLNTPSSRMIELLKQFTQN